MPKKKGPPYTDDPGCRYIVIEDPWPGNATGKARSEVYFNHLCTWVYFMLDKKTEAEAVYSLNTRDEVIVRLPHDTNIAPILGAHPWRRFLSHGHPRDKDRVSYVFEYDYRSRGEPGNHNWLETYPTVNGDPPPHIRFPVVFPYPHVSYAALKGTKCADIALALPSTRQATPEVDTSLFTPYQHPSLLTSTTVESAQAPSRESALPPKRQSLAEPSSVGKLGKLDPYEEETNALHSLKREFVDSSLLVKQEPSVKADPYGPSKAFRNAVENLHCATTQHGSEDGQQMHKPAVKQEAPTVPSEAFIEAFRRARGDTDDAMRDDIRVKQDAQEEALPSPSNAFRAAFERLRGNNSATATCTTNSSSSSVPTPGERRAKPEPAESRLQDLHSAGGNNGIPVDPRLALKRVKEEESNGTHERKKFKSESMY
ncbi:hypothetical protein GY45DRAFT_1276257 [Cubamyces sp. BRFM 1775]|nr:hypothetical protein GY45DRAFT_1276257 [Cubamyces sp. BRFM 1775]